ncbi:hypothetical protein ES703_10099 [subsurface metagenome]
MLLVRKARGGNLRKFIACLVVATFFVAFAPALATAPLERAQVIIVFKERPNPALIAGVGGEVIATYVIIPGLAARVPTGALEELRKNPAVAYIEPDAVVYALGQQVPWGINRIGAPTAWSSSTGAEVKVAILDTGIQGNHPDLAANVKGGISVVGETYSTDPADWNDGHGHGTHVAGTVAAVNNDVGVVGSAPDAWLYGVKVLSDSGEGPLSDVIEGIDWSVQNGMQVLNMSLGTDVHLNSFEEACDQAYEAGLLLVAAAGNEGDGDPDTTELSYPAAYDSVMAVSMTDSNDQVPSSSNSGTFVELAAPGVSIYSTHKGSGYTTKSGTSMAAPHVSGTAALVWAWNPSLTNVQLRSILQQTAEDLGPAGRDTVYGYGLVRADEAVPIYGVGVSISPSDQSASLGATLEYTVSVINQGNVADNYALTVSDNAGWGPTLSDNSLTIPAGENGSATLTVVIPENALDDAEDNITVTATSQTDNTASASASCIAEALVTASGLSDNLPYDHVILIVIDGVRPDVLVGANTPNFDNLTAEGSYTWNAWTVTPSVTIKAIPSIYTGATPEVHGVTDWDGEIYAETIVEVFEEAGLPCAIVGQDPILGGYSATYCTGYYYHPEADENFTSTAIEWFIEYRPFFLTIYNPMPDRRGHAYGHESAEYREAIENADYHVGRFVQTLKNQGVYDRTLIVITTDHGMTGTSHGYGYENDMRIFSIWRGPRVKENYQMVDNVYIPASATYEETYVAHRIIDIAPTMTSLVGLRAPENSEGDIIYQIFQKADIKLENIYTIKLDVDISLQSGSTLVVKFYTYASGYQGENVVWSGATPDNVSFSKIVPHPNNKAVEKVKLDLTTDNTEEEIYTVASFIVRKVDLETRFMEIPMYWAAAPPEGKVELEIEFMEIPMYWAAAPS